MNANKLSNTTRNEMVYSISSENGLSLEVVFVV